MKLNEENYLSPNVTREDINKRCKAQKIYCIKEKVPHFAPIDGNCFHCNRQIYLKITLQKAENELITGCPWCHYSYCE